MTSLLDTIQVDDKKQRENAFSVFTASLGDEAIPFVLQILSKGADSDKYKAAGIIQRMAWERENIKRLVSKGAIPLLVGLLTNGTDGAKTRACEALANMMIESYYTIQIVMSGAVPVVVSLLADQQSVSEAALLFLSNLSAYEESINHVLNGECFPQLVAHLKAGTTTGKDYIISILNNLIHYRWKIDVSAVAPDLVLLAVHGETEFLRIRVLKLLGSLALDSTMRQIFTANKVVASLIQALDRGTEKERDEALKVLVCFVRKRIETAEESVPSEEDALTALISLLSTGTNEGRGYAALTLARTIDDEESSRFVAQAGATTPVVQLITTPGLSEVVVRNGVAALWELMRDDDNRIAIMRNRKILPLLLRLIKDGELTTKAVASSALANIVCNENAPKIIQAGVVPMLMEMMRERIPQAALGAVAAMRALAWTTKGRSHLLAAGALCAVIDLLIYGQEEAQNISVACLHRMVLDVLYPVSINKLVAVAPVMPLLQSMELGGCTAQKITQWTSGSQPACDDLHEQPLRAVLRRRGLSEVLEQLSMHEDAEIRNQAKGLLSYLAIVLAVV